MEVTKNEYQSGLVKLRPNVKADVAYVNGDLLSVVIPDDQPYMIAILNHCATTIGRKHQDVFTCIIPLIHRETGVVLSYTVYVSLPITTIIKDTDLTYIRAVGGERVQKSIEAEVKMPKDATPFWRLTIEVHSIHTMPETKSMSIVNIYVNNTHRVNIAHPNTEIDSDQRGSTKRTRHNYASDGK